MNVDAALIDTGLHYDQQITVEHTAPNTTSEQTFHNIAQAKRLAQDVIFMASARAVEHTPSSLFFKEPASIQARHFLDGVLIDEAALSSM